MNSCNHVYQIRCCLQDCHGVPDNETKMDLKDAADKVMEMYEKMRLGLCLLLLQPACTHHMSQLLNCTLIITCIYLTACVDPCKQMSARVLGVASIHQTGILHSLYHL